jgi:hypothetical protein
VRKALEIDLHAASLALQSIDHDSPQLNQFLIFCGAPTEYLSSILMLSENTLKLHRKRMRHQFVGSSFNALFQDARLHHIYGGKPTPWWMKSTQDTNLQMT